VETSTPVGSVGRPSWKPTLERLFTTEEGRAHFSDITPNILLYGLVRSGKTSIAKVVFHKTSPHETLYLHPTALPDVQKVANTSLMKSTLVDFPGGALFDTSFDELIFPKTQSIVFVIDAQNEPYTSEIAHCRDVFKRAWMLNPKVNLEVFIHKVDGDFFAVDEVRAECQRDIHDKLMSHLHEDGVSASVIFYSTSIYDHTIFEACSRVVQRLVPQASTLEQLLDLLVAHCRMEKAFLIDVLSKTFIATDSSPFDPFNYELCTDMIEIVIEMSCIYGHPVVDDKVKGPASSDQSLGLSAPSASDSRGASEDVEDSKTSTMCLIQLSTGHILYLRELDRLVALVCVIREENFDRQYLVDYNIRIFRDTMLRLFAVPQVPPAG